MDIGGWMMGVEVDRWMNGLVCGWINRCVRRWMAGLMEGYRVGWLMGSWVDKDELLGGQVGEV